MTSVASLLRTESIPLPDPICLLRLVNGRQCKMMKDCCKWNPKKKRAALLKTEDTGGLREGRHICRQCSKDHKRRLLKEHSAQMAAQHESSETYWEECQLLLECFDRANDEYDPGFAHAIAELARLEEFRKKSQKIVDMNFEIFGYVQ